MAMRAFRVRTPGSTDDATGRRTIVDAVELTTSNAPATPEHGLLAGVGGVSVFRSKSALITVGCTPSRDVAADTKSTSAVEDIGLRERLPVEVRERPDPYVPEYVW